MAASFGRSHFNFAVSKTKSLHPNFALVSEVIPSLIECRHSRPKFGEKVVSGYLFYNNLCIYAKYQPICTEIREIWEDAFTFVIQSVNRTEHGPDFHCVLWTHPASFGCTRFKLGASKPKSLRLGRRDAPYFKGCKV